jgi:N utilization substance protein A
MSGNFEMMEALQALAVDKGIPADTLLEALANALVAAYKRMPGAAEEAYVTIDAESFEIRVYGQELDEDGNVTREWDDTPDDFGRIAAQTAKQVLMQGVREAERELKYEEYAGREGDIVTGIIQQTDSRFTLLDLGKVEALLPQAEQVPFERPEPGTRLKAYIVEVRKNPRGPQIVVSRTHPGLIKRLFELEVPEIADGIVELKAVAREPGHRTKVAVWSNDHNVDPVGACVGARGARVRMVVNELRGEKIDIVPFTEAVQDFVMRALSPAKVKEVRLDEETGTAEVIVPDYQLSLAIGKEGQNARLAARLTGWRVDIKSETQLADEEAGYDGEEWAEGEWATDPSTGEMVWKPAEGGPAVTAEEWSHGDTTAEGAMVDSGGDRVPEVGEDGTVRAAPDADPDARPDDEVGPQVSATLPVDDDAPALAGDQHGEAALPDDEVETLEAGMVAQTTEATAYDDAVELEGAPIPAEEAAVLEGGAEPLAVSDEALEEDLDLLGVPDDERAFDALPTDQPVLATDDPEQALAEGGDTPTLEGPDPMDGASG